MPTSVKDFLSGWRNLPDELKLQVLRHALPSGLILRSEIFEAKNHGIDYDFAYPYFQRDILPFLSCPETASLAIEILYTQNPPTFFIPDRFPDKLTPLPLNSARKFIRTWKAILNIEDVYSSRLRILVESLRRAQKTEKIILFIQGEPETTPRIVRNNSDILAGIRGSLKDMDKIDFDTDKLEIFYKIDGKWSFFDNLTNVFQEKLVIVDNGMQVEQEIERSVTGIDSISMCHRIATGVSIWQAVLTPGKHIRHVKITQRR